MPLALTKNAIPDGSPPLRSPNSFLPTRRIKMGKSQQAGKTARVRGASKFRQNRHNGSLNGAARDLNRTVGVDVDVDFAANAKL